MGDEEAVLFANEAFYAAFSDQDAAAMREIWARNAQVVCIHPGWDVLIGYDAVMDSWQAILGSPSAPRIEVRDPRVVLHDDIAFVACNEILNGGLLSAMNAFLRTGGLWKMIHHQAGPIANAQRQARAHAQAPKRSVLH
jgi:hypothetical protein